ncbi:hypothetical protein EV421DRAFT_1743601 [Armillaria borealis]|uniref:Uncharacterized protein n=1 Tax=Armillaria borealis TaxID=47425 RepID=A0AA39IXZ2_9AGAR|nr:hypothetical protein EV421DRAFT_1743601 [Armillaria borealis]
MDDEMMQETWVCPFIPTYRSVVQYSKSTLDAYLLGLFMAYHACFRCLLGTPTNPNDLNSVRAWKLTGNHSPDSPPTIRRSDPPCEGADTHSACLRHSSAKNDSLVPVPSSSKPVSAGCSPFIDLLIPGCSSSDRIGGEHLMTGSKRTRGSSSDGEEEPTPKRRCLELGAVSPKAEIHINFWQTLLISDLLSNVRNMCIFAGVAV